MQDSYFNLWLSGYSRITTTIYSGSVLVYRLNAPILLVGSSEADQGKIPDYLKANLEANGTAYILGGAGVIGKSFEDELGTNGIKKISRLAGG